MATTAAPEELPTAVSSAGATDSVQRLAKSASFHSADGEEPSPLDQQPQVSAIVAAPTSTKSSPAIAVDATAVPSRNPAINSVLPSSISQPQSKIVEEFQFLAEKSAQLFAGLRELPPFGGPRQWQPYFLRAFEVYTKVSSVVIVLLFVILHLCTYIQYTYPS
jgi:hypothetical protein